MLPHACCDVARVNTSLPFISRIPIMKLIKEIAFASALTLASFMAMPSAIAHEIKFGDLVIGHP